MLRFSYRNYCLVCAFGTRRLLEAELRRPICDGIPSQEHRRAATISRGASAEEGSQTNQHEIDSTSASATGTDTRAQQGHGAGAQGSNWREQPVPAQLQSWPVVISNLPRTALREDVLHFLPPLDLKVAHIRPAYNQRLRPMRFWVNLHTEEKRLQALSRDGHFLGLRRASVRPGTIQQMEEDLRTPLAGSSRGRYLLLKGLGRRCTADDVMKLFHGFELMSAAVSMVRGTGRQEKEKPQNPENGHNQEDQMAVVRLASPREAHRALRRLNGSFVKEHRITMRVLL